MITVCIAFGPDESLERLDNTLASVALQSLFLISVLVLPHYSIDKSLFYPFKHRYQFVTILEMHDVGIFHAQNLLGSSVQTPFFIFLGCGDCVSDNYALEDVAANILNIHERMSYSCFYTPVILTDKNKVNFTLFNNTLYHRLAKSNIQMAGWIVAINALVNPMHTQGIVFNTRWFQANPYSLKKGIYSDLIHVLSHKLYLYSFWIPRPLVIFLLDGESSRLKNPSHILGHLLECGRLHASTASKTIFFFVGFLKYIKAFFMHSTP